MYQIFEKTLEICDQSGDYLRFSFDLNARLPFRHEKIKYIVPYPPTLFYPSQLIKTRPYHYKPH